MSAAVISCPRRLSTVATGHGLEGVGRKWPSCKRLHRPGTVASTVATLATDWGGGACNKVAGRPSNKYAARYGKQTTCNQSGSGQTPPVIWPVSP
jgi:hypothetical protein